MQNEGLASCAKGGCLPKRSLFRLSVKLRAATVGSDVHFFEPIHCDTLTQAYSVCKILID